MTRPALTLHVNEPLDPYAEKVRLLHLHIAHAIADINNLRDNTRGVNREIATVALSQINMALSIVTTLSVQRRNEDAP